MADETVEPPKSKSKGRDPVRRRASRKEYARLNRERLNKRMREYRSAHADHINAQRRENAARRAALRPIKPKPTAEEIRQKRAKQQRDRRSALTPQMLAVKRADEARRARERRLRSPDHFSEIDRRRAPKRREVIQQRYKRDIIFRLKCALRARLVAALKRHSSGGAAITQLGCSIPEFRAYIESLFQPGMSWDDWGQRGFHIDHIRPLASFDLTDPIQLLTACHYTNLQPLWWRDNLRKSTKIID